LAKKDYLQQAEAARMAKNKAKERAKELPDTTKTICFDLQKTLPTPVLTCSKVYYLRQLWTYNFCIYDLASGRPICTHGMKEGPLVDPRKLALACYVMCKNYHNPSSTLKHSVTMLEDRTKISKF
jgi:hypothetical protein